MDPHPSQTASRFPKCSLTTATGSNQAKARIKPTAPEKSKVDGGAISGQSYKHFTLVNYDSRVIPDLKIPHITTLES